MKRPAKSNLFAILSGVAIITIVVVLLYHIVYGHIITGNACQKNKKEGIDKQWHEYVDVIYYINLDEREDQKTRVLEEMRKMVVPENKIVRVPGVKKRDREEWGHSLSHMIVMEYFLDTSHNNCIVFEDNFVFQQDLSTVNKMFAEVFQTAQNFDVIMLSAKDIDAKPSNHACLKKVNSAGGVSGYMVNRYYAQPLMQNLQDGAKTIEKSYEAGKSDALQGPFLVDQYWKRLQPQSNWFVFSPEIGKTGQ